MNIRNPHVHTQGHKRLMSVSMTPIYRWQLLTMPLRPDVTIQAEKFERAAAPVRATLNASRCDASRRAAPRLACDSKAAAAAAVRAVRWAAGQGDRTHHLVDAVVDGVVELLRLVGGVDDHESVRLLARAVEESVQRVAHVLADPLNGKKTK